MSGFALYAAAMDVCDPDLNAHAARVGALAEMIAQRLAWDEERIDDLKLGATIHDVGKIALRQDVLRKPGPLDPDEIAQVQTHPVEGAWLVAGVRSLVPALPYVLFHHERWDGTGYPTRRARKEIPVEGRLLAIADAFDAMTSSRPYRAALTLEAALDEVDRCAGSQFDPEIAEAFLDAWRAGEIAPAPPLVAAAG